MDHKTTLQPPTEATAGNNMRRRSNGTVEMTDDKGRRKTVQLDELNEADRALAEQFGYKPVR
jgi:hypothetical protein